MSLKDVILEKFSSSVEKQNPWQPYTGPAGGQGWVNVMTGEVRYQENRPAPEEGMPEDHDGDIPTPEEEPPEELEPAEPPSLGEALEPGMTVSGEDFGEGQVVDTDPEEGTVDVEIDGWGEETISTDDIEEHPVQLEPPDGWGRGWTDGPDEISDLEYDQSVEIYDTESGEYIEGRVQMVEEDDPDFEGDYVSIQTDDGPVEIAPGIDVGEEYLITAQEDFDAAPEGVPEGFEEISIEEMEERFDDGENVFVSVDNDEVFPEDSYPAEYTEDGDLNVVVDNEIKQIQTDKQAHRDQLEGIYALPPDFKEPGEIQGFESSPDIVEGEYASFDHPVFGEVEGEVEVTEDSEGYEWLTIQEEGTDPEELEEGDTFEYETEGGDVFDAEVAEVSADPNYDEIGVDRGDGEIMWIDFDSIVTEGDEVSVTTNPEHPFYIGDIEGGVESPWTPTEDPKDHSSTDVGDTVLYNGEALDVVSRKDDGLTLEDGTELGIQDLHDIEAVTHSETPDVPHGFDEWEDPPDQYNPDDTVYFYDENTGEVVQGKIEDPVDEDDEEAFVQDEHGGESYVDTDYIGGHVPSGAPELPSGDDLAWTEEGEYASITYREHEQADPKEVEGFIMSHDDFSGRTEVFDPETGETVTIRDTEQAVVTDYPEPPDTYQEWEDASTDEIVNDISEHIDLSGHMVDKGRLKAQLMTHHNPKGVQEFTNSLAGGGNDAWKHDSGTMTAGQYEKAMKKAADIKAATRDGHAPSREAVEVAKTVNELSQERWRRNPPDQVFRGLSNSGGAGLMANYLSDPFDKEEYEVPLLAVNNFTEQRGTAESLGTSPMVVYEYGEEIDPEQVAAYHDDFFSHANDGEAEIAMSGENFTVPRDQFYVGNDKDVNFGDPPHEWDQEVAQAFKRKVNGYGKDILYDANPNGEPSARQLENAIRIGRVLEEKHNISTTGTEFFNEARELYEENHGDPEQVDYPELRETYTADDMSGDWEPFGGDPETLEPGDWVRVEPGVHGDPVEGKVERAGSGEIIIDEDSVDAEVALDSFYYPGEIEAVSETGGGADFIGNVEPDAVEEGEYLYYEDLDGNVQEGTVFDVATNDAGEPVDVKIGEPMDTTWVGVDDLGQDPSEAEESEPSGGIGDTPLNSNIDLEPGDVIDHPEFTSTVTVTDITDDGEIIAEDSNGYEENISEDHFATVTSNMIEEDQSEGSDMPSLAETDLVQNDPEYEMIDEGDYVVYDGEVFEVDEKPDSPMGDFRLVGDDGDEKWMPEWHISELVEESGGSDGTTESELTGSFDEADVGDTVQFESNSGEQFEQEVVDTFEDPKTGEELLVTDEGYVSPSGSNASGYNFVGSEGSDETFGAIENGFDSIDEIEETYDLNDDPQTGGTEVEYLDPETGEVETGTLTATFPSMDAVHIDGEEDPIAPEHVREAEPEDDPMAEGSDESNDPADSAMDPSALHEVGASHLEEFTLDTPNGPEEVVVMDVPEDPEGPYRVKSGDKEQWLVWPDGSFESV